MRAPTSSPDREVLTPGVAARVVLIAMVALGAAAVGVREMRAHVFPPGSFQVEGATPARLLILLVIAAAATALLWVALTRRWFFDRFVGPATPRTLGIMRTLGCAALLQHVFYEPLESLALIPTEFRTTSRLGVMGVLDRLDLIDPLVQSSTLLAGLRWTTAGLLVLAMVGWRTRVTLPLGAAFYMVFAGLLRQYSWFWHMGLIPLTLVFGLALTPCGDGFSIDSVLRAYRGENGETGRASKRYGWARWFGWSILAILYTLVGFSKLANGGPMWAHPDNVRGIFLSNALDKNVLGLELPLKMIGVPNAFFLALGVATLVAESTYALVLFSKRARQVLPLIMIGMHLGILLMMDVVFVGAMICQLVFLDFEHLRRRVADAVRARRGKVRVLYDGWCPLCQHTVRVLSSLDLFERLEILDFRDTDLDALGEVTGHTLSRSELEDEMTVMAAGRVTRGYDGYRVLAWALPVAWPIAWLLALPPFSAVGRPLYRWIARRRPLRLACDETCRASHEAPMPTSRRVSRMGMWPVYAVASWVVVIGLSVAWSSRTEAYPLSSLQMFSSYNASGSIDYYRVNVHYADGTVARTYLDEAIGALHNTRFRPQLTESFDPERRERVTRYFSAVGNAYNSRRPPSLAVRYEVQKWSWDFRSDRLNREYGNMLDRVFFDVSPASP
jgi:predicted DCC family thiol-disulfide oxidoreductase YuxK